MEGYKAEIIETIIVALSYIIIKLVFTKSVDGVKKKFGYQKPRINLISKQVNFFLFLICSGFILFIWGVDQSELVFFISSLLTVLGIALFAQWSIISNITASLIIFFNHPAKIDDEITVLDKDYQVQGHISDIGIFFIIVKTIDGDKVTIPSNIFIQKMVKWRAEKS